MSRALFVSDIHIRFPDDPRAGLFRRFLFHLRSDPPAHLFLNGDIFDLWVADHDFFTTAYKDIIDDLVGLKSLGTQIHYFEGNHDLDLRLFWQHRLGFDVQDGPAYYEIDGQVVRVEHGDQMDPEDRGYHFLRWFLRTGFMRFLGRYLPDRMVRAIGFRASHVSRDYTSTIKTATDERVRAKIRAHVSKVFNERPFDWHLSGHVHVTEEARLELSGRSVGIVNTGTWLNEPMVFELRNGQGRLQPIKAFLP